MENRFNNRDFEQFVKQNADQYRMFPSEKVWNNIHNTLHTRRRLHIIGLGLLILSAAVVTWVMLNTADKNKQVVSTLPEVVVKPVAMNIKQAEPLIIPTKRENSKTAFITSTDKLQKDLFKENIDINTDNFTNSFASNNNEPTSVIKTEIITPAEAKVKNTQLQNKLFSDNKTTNTPVASIKVNNYSFTKTQFIENKEDKTPISNEIIFIKNDIYPLSIESVINSYKHIRKRKKTSLEFYLTPTISYRSLKENKPFINAARNATSGVASSYYSTDINNVVTHKPDLGLQLGFTVGYPLSKKVKIIAGLQFNVSKYDIRAYSHPSEVATIALSNAAGGTNTFSTVTNYRNAGGSKADWLKNLYFSASAPIGLELKLLGNRKTYMGISGTIQPTYITSNRSYLLSTDYKNYAEVPSLIRKWNINTGFEVFAGYTTGKLKWRVGPQVRYQTMSSFQKKYPVQEHLFDFGLKLGIMLK